jgi:hypothetical protein
VPALAFFAGRRIKNRFFAEGAADGPLAMEFIEPQLGIAIRAGDPLPGFGIIRDLDIRFTDRAFKIYAQG